MAPAMLTMPANSRRAQVRQRFEEFRAKFVADTAAEGNPIKEIAVGFILIAVAMVIALTILPVVTSSVATAADDGNITSSDATLLRLLPTLLIVGLLAGGVAFLFRGFKQLKA